MSSISLAEFADKLNELMPEMARSIIRRQSDELLKGKITLPQFFILNVLKKEDEQRMTDIARLLNVTTAAATGIVDRMVRSGYVTRVYDPQDRRIIRIRLSAKGAEVVQRIISHRRQMIMDTFGKISQQEREEYLRILMRVKDVLTEENRQ